MSIRQVSELRQTIINPNMTGSACAIPATRIFFCGAPPEAGSARQLIHGEWHVGAQFGGLFHGAGPSWTPDSRKILVDSYDDPDRDLSDRRSHIYAVDAASGEKTWLTEEAG